MQRVEIEIARLIKEIDYDEVTELFSSLSGGKRLRAKLILKIAPEHKDAPLLAAIVELIHGASLLHDDVIDDAMTRRGVTSVNASNGSKVAVMLGDILYSKAFTELISFDKDIAQTIAASVTALSKGEMMDVKMAENFNSDESLYLDMLYLKTATLIEAAAKASALLVGKDAEKHALYGRNLGLSFQIIDDILDITESEKVLGKPVMNDYVEGKCTLPYIYLYEVLNDADKQRLKLLHGKVLSEDEKIWIKSMMHNTGLIQKSYNEAKALIEDAIALMNARGESALSNIAIAMIERDF